MLRASSCLHADHSDASTHLRGSPPNLPQSDRHPQALEALRGETYRIKVDASVCCVDDAVSQHTMEPTSLHCVCVHLAYLAYVNELSMIESLLVRYNSIVHSAYCLWVRPWRGVPRSN
jgi:hypothetical protein